MIFVTVGSMFPYDRLIRSVDELVAEGVITGAVEAQIGDGHYTPTHMPYVRFLDKPSFEQKFREADAVISHAGAGTIAMALSFQKPLLAMPRLARHGEHVNDHQVATAAKFAELRHLLAADDKDALAQALPRLPAFRPQPRMVHSQDLAARIGAFLSAAAAR